MLNELLRFAATGCGGDGAGLTASEVGYSPILANSEARSQRFALRMVALYINSCECMTAYI